ncbi:SDR family NAD(P)-dependent oxidoreductase [Serratia proteamaculans]|uniref:SDR family oxidoreductase n=1 Tax=Serratia proteamaculans TaxID=28151 RepID=A0A5Q2V603_SERPR|nr:SDR family oxidoreductase [Serratia proteamaculans]QGH59788.1 SDR family oxidoreductase [Serratia proteamaculans]
MQLQPLKNKIALITGSAQGLGAEIAKSLAEDGASIILHDRDEERLNSVVQEISQAGGNVLQLISADLSLSSAADNIVGQLQPNSIDILVNNAGIAPVSPFANVDEALFDAMANVNMRSVFFLTQKLLPKINDGGRIINISSSLKKTYAEGFITYVSIKGFIEAFTKYLAGEVGGRAITVNAISPGAINTGLNPWFESAEGRSTLLKDQALKTLGVPTNIAHAITFLAGPKADWISGAIIDVDGGFKLTAS